MYVANRSMDCSALANADGDMLIVPQQGGCWGARQRRTSRGYVLVVPHQGEWDWGHTATGCLATSVDANYSRASERQAAERVGPTERRRVRGSLLPGVVHVLTKACRTPLAFPLAGALRLKTEFGLLDVAPGEVAVVQRGMRFSVVLHGEAARGYVLEVGRGLRGVWKCAGDEVVLHGEAARGYVLEVGCGLRGV